MPQAQGANTRIIYDQETTYGTTPGSPAAKVLPFLTESLSQNRALMRSQILRANRNLTKPVRGNKNAGGTITTELNPYMGILWKHILGSVTTAGSGPYTHTIKVGTLPTSLCIEKQFTDLATPQYFLYNGCRINKASLEFRSEGFVPFSIDVIAKKETVSTSSFHASPTDYGHLPWEMYEATIEEGGSSIAIVTEARIDISNDLDDSNFVVGGAGERRALPAGKAVVTGTLTALFEDVTLYTKAINHTESSLRIVLTRGNGGGTAGNEFFEIKIPELVYEQKAPVISGPKGVLVALDFSAYYDDSTEASSAQVIIKNTQATL